MMGVGGCSERPADVLHAVLRPGICCALVFAVLCCAVLWPTPLDVLLPHVLCCPLPLPPLYVSITLSRIWLCLLRAVYCGLHTRYWRMYALLLTPLYPPPLPLSPPPPLIILVSPTPHLPATCELAGPSSIQTHILLFPPLPSYPPPPPACWSAAR